MTRVDVAIVIALVALLVLLNRRLESGLVWLRYVLMIAIAAVTGWVFADVLEATRYYGPRRPGAYFDDLLVIIERAMPVVLVLVLGLVAVRVNRGLGDRRVTRRMLRLTLVVATVFTSVSALCALWGLMVRLIGDPNTALLTIRLALFRPFLHLLFAVWMLVVLRGSLRRVVVQGRCANCGYDVSAAPGDRCPECGGDPRPVHERCGSMSV